MAGFAVAGVINYSRHHYRRSWHDVRSPIVRQDRMGEKRLGIGLQVDEASRTAECKVLGAAENIREVRAEEGRGEPIQKIATPLEVQRHFRAKQEFTWLRIGRTFHIDREFRSLFGL